MIIFKFGGTSLESAARIAAVANIIRERARDSSLAIVVSAMAGVTDALTDAARVAAKGRDEYAQVCESLRVRHREAAFEIALHDERAGLGDRIERRLEWPSFLCL